MTDALKKKFFNAVKNAFDFKHVLAKMYIEDIFLTYACHLMLILLRGSV